MASAIQDNDSLGRFIFSSAHFSRQNKRVKHNAFMPASNGKVSMFNITGMQAAECWAVGAEVATTRQQTLYARADLLALIARRQSLDVISDEPPPRHANIVGWPPDKDAQKLIAMELAESAELVLKP